MYKDYLFYVIIIPMFKKDVVYQTKEEEQHSQKCIEINFK